jgi:hypothetical protein
VFESGWSESYPELIADKNLWLDGGAPHVNVVIIVKWSWLVQNRIKCFLEMWKSNNPIPFRFVRISPNSCDHQITVSLQSTFPGPPPGTPPQQLPITLGELYGASLPANRNANEVLMFSVDEFRNLFADDALREEGYIPA